MTMTNNMISRKIWTVQGSTTEFRTDSIFPVRVLDNKTVSQYKIDLPTGMYKVDRSLISFPPWSVELILPLVLTFEKYSPRMWEICTNIVMLTHMFMKDNFMAYPCLPTKFHQNRANVCHLGGFWVGGLKDD